MATAARVAALYDVHGNLPALEAVLDDVRRAGVDRVVIGGDVVPGPMPVETLERVLALGIPTEFVSGNGERIVLAEMMGGDISEVPERYRDAIRWNARQLRPEHQASMAGWHPTCRVNVEGLGDVVFCHATVRNDSEAFTRLSPDARVEPMFASVDAPVVVCGHSHMQFDRRVGGRVRVVNAGSIGAPFAAPPGAYWLLLGPDVELRRTDYDFSSAAERCRRTGYPLVEELTVRYILAPPPEAETLAMYAPLDSK